jgi:hypothetical protein
MISIFDNSDNVFVCLRTTVALFDKFYHCLICEFLFKRSSK